MLKKLFCIFASLIFLFNCVSVCSAVSEPSVSAESAALLSIADNRFIFEKNADMRLPMASTTKIMTCIIALENGSLTDTVTVPAESVGIEGSSLYLNAGDTLSLGDLLYALMLRSANDAAATVAYHIAGDIPAFADMMNTKAASIGMTNTHFTNPHGLHDEAHYTTAHDFALLAAYALSNGDFCKIVSTTDYTVSINGGSCKKPVVNHNKLLRIYEGANGIKTGFTKSSGRCLVSSAERNGVSFAAVTLNAPSDWDDHIRLLDYGFSQYENRVLFEKGQLLRSFSVAGCNTLEAGNDEPFSAVVRRDAKITVKTEGKHLMFPPVYEGDEVARVTVFADGIPLGSVTLTALHDCVLPDEPTLTDKLKALLNFNE